MSAGDQLDIMGPLGNGWNIDFLKRGEAAVIITGGIGTPPMYQLSKNLNSLGVEVTHFIGNASGNVMFYKREFEQLGKTYWATDDGSFGFAGTSIAAYNKLRNAVNATGVVNVAGGGRDAGVVNVAGVVNAGSVEPNAIFACGSIGLLKAVNENFKDHPNAYISMEARMACGIGACYSCVLRKTSSGGDGSLKACVDGPIFKVGEVVVDE
jgi:dihydroorotate dehydrogenase electron transfer subunit